MREFAPAGNTVPELLSARAAVQPDRPAIITDTETLTFGDWDRRSTAVAAGLLDRGLCPGDPVGLLFGGADWTGFAAACLGVQRAGGVAVPLSDKLPGRAVADALIRCGAAGLVHAHGLSPHPAVRAAGLWTATPDLLDLPGSVEVRISPEDPAQIVFTSGTTGSPKGVMASHANLTHGHTTRPRLRPYAHSERFLHAFPIGTNAGQMMLIDALTAHPAALARPAFDAASWCALIESERVGTLFLVPSMAIELLRSPAVRDHDLSGVLLVSSSAAALPPAVALELTRVFPAATVVNCYISTESAPARTTMIVDPERPDSLGRPADPSALRIADEEFRPVAPGETGEIWLRSDAPARSYIDSDDDQSISGGWIRMGDLGRLDDDGHLYLVDRDTDVVKSGGLKVSTVRVEAALHHHPAVVEAAVVGVPHEVMGATVAAAIRVAEPFDPDDLRDFLGRRLARHELPTQIRVVTTLPHNATGKIIKAEVRELFARTQRPDGETCPTP